MHTGLLHPNMTQLIANLGDFGVFVAMFLESSIVPIPSEVIIIGAGSIGVPLTSILIFGALGSTCGAMVGYLLGRYAAMPVILKFGKFILIKPHHIYKAEAFAKKYGVRSVLIGRILPIVPFKVFSIAAGITKIAFVPFVVCTMVGVVPRIYLLALFGATIVQYKKPALLAFLLIGLVFLAFKLTRMIYSRPRGKARNISKEASPMSADDLE
jgi:membrane protein DedA with SNARE-associated domain